MKLNIHLHGGQIYTCPYGVIVIVYRVHLVLLWDVLNDGAVTAHTAPSAQLFLAAMSP